MRNQTRKRTRQNKQSGRVSKWMLPSFSPSDIRRMDREKLEKYAKIYKIKDIKKYSDKELARELINFIPSDKIRSDYYKCIKSKKIGKYPIKARNDTSKAYQKMSLHEQVKHDNRKHLILKKKHKKEIEAYNKRSRKAYEECEEKRKKQMEKQIKGQTKGGGKRTRSLKPRKTVSSRKSRLKKR